MEPLFAARRWGGYSYSGKKRSRLEQLWSRQNILHGHLRVSGGHTQEFAQLAANFIGLLLSFVWRYYSRKITAQGFYDTWRVFANCLLTKKACLWHFQNMLQKKKYTCILQYVCFPCSVKTNQIRKESLPCDKKIWKEWGNTGAVSWITVKSPSRRWGALLAQSW